MLWQATLRYNSNVSLTDSFDFTCKSNRVIYITKILINCKGMYAPDGETSMHTIRTTNIRQNYD
jgi:hypothetical protein